MAFLKPVSVLWSDSREGSTNGCASTRTRDECWTDLLPLVVGQISAGLRYSLNHSWSVQPHSDWSQARLVLFLSPPQLHSSFFSLAQDYLPLCELVWVVKGAENCTVFLSDWCFYWVNLPTWLIRRTLWTLWAAIWGQGKDVSRTVAPGSGSKTGLWQSKLN